MGAEVPAMVEWRDFGMEGEDEDSHGRKGSRTKRIVWNEGEAFDEWVGEVDQGC